jgi:hypothetical protein
MMSKSNTSRHTTSSKHTNHEWGSEYSHSARQAHQWDDVFPTEIFHSAKSSGLLTENLLHTHTHIRSSTIRNLPRCDRTEQCPDNPLTQCIQTVSPPFGPQTSCYTWKQFCPLVLHLPPNSNFFNRVFQCLLLRAKKKVITSLLKFV